MDKEFEAWFKTHEKGFAHSQLDEKQIAYAAWVESKKHFDIQIHIAEAYKTVNCDSCGCVPSIVFRTQHGTFCFKHVKY